MPAKPAQPRLQSLLGVVLLAGLASAVTWLAGPFAATPPFVPTEPTHSSGVPADADTNASAASPESAVRELHRRAVLELAAKLSRRGLGPAGS